MGKGLSYYEILGVTRNADDVEIKKAYRRLALRYHPEVDATPSASQEFTAVCEAYDVLSNHRTKGFYDLYGEVQLKAAVQKEGAPPPYQFDPVGGPQAVFAAFFGTNNPYEALQGLAAKFEHMTTAEKVEQGKQTTCELQLPLEEIYRGCVKVVSHTRRVVSDLGEVREEERQLTVDVRPGAPDGTTFVFHREGDVAPHQAPGPVEYVLRGAPHPRFSRRGADLVHRVRLPLLAALCGGAVGVQTLDGRSLSVALDGVVTPGHSITVQGEGMPRADGGKGDLVVEFELLFPGNLSEAQKTLLRAGLLLPQHVADEAQAKALRAFESAFKDKAHGWSTGVVKGGGVR